MEHIKIINGKIVNGIIETDFSPQGIYETLMSGTTMVIKNAFHEAQAIQLRDMVFSWGLTQKLSSPEDFYNFTRKNLCK